MQSNCCKYLGDSVFSGVRNKGHYKHMTTRQNQITLNIGLSSGTGPCAPHLILADLRHNGFIITQSRIVQGVWEGKPEACLVLVASYVFPLQFKESKLCICAALVEIAKRHAQDCIAIEWPDGTGDLVPAQKYAFDAAFFHRIEEKKVCPHCKGKGEVSCGW